MGKLGSVRRLTAAVGTGTGDVTYSPPKSWGVPKAGGAPKGAFSRRRLQAAGGVGVRRRKVREIMPGGIGSGGGGGLSGVGGKRRPVSPPSRSWGTPPAGGAKPGTFSKRPT